MPFFLFQAATFIAGYAFPVLPYELFVPLPWILAYFIEKPTVKVTVTRLVIFITYWGALYGAGVHSLALLALLDGQFKLENLGMGGTPEAGLCSALPPPTPRHPTSKLA